MTNEPRELSSAGARRRARMLPLLQDAVRDRVRRKRRRRAVAGSLFVFALIIGSVEFMDGGGSVMQEPGDRLADAGGGTESMSPGGIPGPGLGPDLPSIPIAPRLDIQAIDATGLYAKAIERDPEIFIPTPAELPDGLRSVERRVLVERVSTDQLMTELAMSGLDSAVVCANQGCRLFIGTPEDGPVNGEPRTSGRGT